MTNPNDHRTAKLLAIAAWILVVVFAAICLWQWTIIDDYRALLGPLP